MASSADRSRVRLCTRQALQEQETLNQARAGCGDEGLRALLAQIGERQAHHSQRLMAWLQPRTDPESPPAATAEEASGEDATDEGAVSRSAHNGAGAVVTELNQVTPELLQIKVPRPQDFHFVAGQSVKLEVDGIRRAYSIVSAPHEPMLEFYIERVPGGQMSERLQRLKVGDRVGLGTPKGGLRLDTTYAEHLMVATVTGINPFVSMLRDYLHRGLQGHRFHLLHGASYRTEFGYRQELEAMAAAHPGLLTYLPTISRPEEATNAGWSGSTGRVHTLIGDYLNQAGLDSRTTIIYACGHSGLLEAVQRDYGPRGFRIRTESYD